MVGRQVRTNERQRRQSTQLSAPVVGRPRMSLTCLQSHPACRLSSHGLRFRDACTILSAARGNGSSELHDLWNLCNYADWAAQANSSSHGPVGLRVVADPSSA